MGIYNRFAKDCSESLFNSIYTDLYSLAARDNAARYAGAKRKKDYRPGEHQEILNDFCFSRMSVGHALDYIKMANVYSERHRP